MFEDYGIIGDDSQAAEVNIGPLIDMVFIQIGRASCRERV